jgi:hypothetical protein
MQGAAQQVALASRFPGVMTCARRQGSASYRLLATAILRGVWQTIVWRKQNLWPSLAVWRACKRTVGQRGHRTDVQHATASSQ